MAIFGISNPFRRKDRASEAVEHPTPDLEKLLAPTEKMLSIWREEAAFDGRISDGMNRRELEARFGGMLPKDMPADRHERSAVIERASFAEALDLHAEHVKEVGRLYDLPDKDVVWGFPEEAHQVPGRDRPRDRADFISGMLMDDMERARDEVQMQPIDLGQYDRGRAWQEHLAGEPGLQVEGGEVEDAARKRFFDSFQIRQPAIADIAMTVVDLADTWGNVGREQLTSGDIRLGDEAADRLLASPGVARPGGLRERTIAEAYVDHYVASVPEARQRWEGEVAVIMEDNPEFLKQRYGVDDPARLAVRDVVVAETLREIPKLRFEAEHAQEIYPEVGTPARAGTETRRDPAPDRASPSVAMRSAGAADMQFGR